MSEKRRTFDRSFGRGLCGSPGRPGNRSLRSAGDLGINEGTLGHWFAQERAEREGPNGVTVADINERKRLRSENDELRMERDVLKRSVVPWVNEATK